MATVNKDFKIKSGLIVEGTTGTINGYDILTKKQDDQDYIVGLIGGTATSANTPNTVVKRDGSGDFAANNVTVNTLYVGGSTNNGIDVVNGDTEVGSNNGIVLSASDDIALNSDSGDIVLNPDGSAYYGAKSSNNEIATRGYVNGEISSLDTASQGYATTAQGNAENYTDSAISTEVTNRNNAINTAKSQAISTAEGYTDSAISTEVTNRNSAISTAKSQAISTSEGYTDSAISSEVTNRNSAISSAISTEVTNRNNAIATAKSEAITAAEGYTDTAVANLVDSAPDLLNTLNELAAAIADNPNYASDVANLVAAKADTTYVDSEISGVDTAAQGYATTAQGNAELYADGLASSSDTNAQGYASTAQQNAENYADSLAGNYDANGSASTAQQNAENYADSLAGNYDANGSAATAQQNAENYTDSAINALTTSDIEEGSNEYFTDSRAKSSAADLLTSANLTNITITGSGAGLTITAENGVADSTTSDLTEGSNLYFTAQRAVDALEAVVPNFTAVELNSVAKQVAATTSVPVAGIATGYAWAKADYRSAEFLVKVAYGSHTEISKVLVTLDTSDNIAITEYGIVGTNGSASSVSAGIAGNDVQLQVTTVNNNSTVTLVGTLLA
jgi:hypothetical protein